MEKTIMLSNVFNANFAGTSSVKLAIMHAVLNKTYASKLEKGLVNPMCYYDATEIAYLKLQDHELYDLITSNATLDRISKHKLKLKINSDMADIYPSMAELAEKAFTETWTHLTINIKEDSLTFHS